MRAMPTCNTETQQKKTMKKREVRSIAAVKMLMTAHTKWN